MEFEGSQIVDYSGKIPAITVEMPEAYVRETRLMLNMEVRVKSVRLEEDKNGDLVRHHVFAVEDVQISSVLSPADLQRALTGGGAAGINQEIVVEPIAISS